MPLKDTAYKKSGLAGIRTRDLPAYSDDRYAEAGALTTRPQAQVKKQEHRNITFRQREDRKRNEK